MFDETLKTVAHALAGHCRNGTESEGLDTLYSPDVVSVEAAAMDGSGNTEAHGLDALRGKHAWWAENTTMHSSSVDG
ncbi:MAG: nuclear transport factor 2 family protein, partial [Pseudomonadota bacterium]